MAGGRRRVSRKKKPLIDAEEQAVLDGIEPYEGPAAPPTKPVHDRASLTSLPDPAEQPVLNRIERTVCAVSGCGEEVSSHNHAVICIGCRGYAVGKMRREGVAPEGPTVQGGKFRAYTMRQLLRALKIDIAALEMPRTGRTARLFHGQRVPRHGGGNA